MEGTGSVPMKCPVLHLTLLPLVAFQANVMSLSWSHDRVTNFNVSYPDF